MLMAERLPDHWQEVRHHDGSVRRWERTCGMYDVVPDIALPRFLCRSYNSDGTWTIVDNRRTAEAARELCDRFAQAQQTQERV